MITNNINFSNIKPSLEGWAHFPLDSVTKIRLHPEYGKIRTPKDVNNTLTGDITLTWPVGQTVGVKNGIDRPYIDDTIQLNVGETLYAKLSQVGSVTGYIIVGITTKTTSIPQRYIKIAQCLEQNRIELFSGDILTKGEWVAGSKVDTALQMDRYKAALNITEGYLYSPKQFNWDNTQTSFGWTGELGANRSFNFHKSNTTVRPFIPRPPNETEIFNPNGDLLTKKWRPTSNNDLVYENQVFGGLGVNPIGSTDSIVDITRNVEALYYATTPDNFYDDQSPSFGKWVMYSDTDFGEVPSTWVLVAKPQGTTGLQVIDKYDLDYGQTVFTSTSPSSHATTANYTPSFTEAIIEVRSTELEREFGAYVSWDNKKIHLLGGFSNFADTTEENGSNSRGIFELPHLESLDYVAVQFGSDINALHIAGMLDKYQRRVKSMAGRNWIDLYDGEVLAYAIPKTRVVGGYTESQMKNGYIILPARDIARRQAEATLVEIFRAEKKDDCMLVRCGDGRLLWTGSGRTSLALSAENDSSHGSGALRAAVKAGEFIPSTNPPTQLPLPTTPDKTLTMSGAVYFTIDEHPNANGKILTLNGSLSNIAPFPPLLPNTHPEITSLIFIPCVTPHTKKIEGLFKTTVIDLTTNNSVDALFVYKEETFGGVTGLLIQVVTGFNVGSLNVDLGSVIHVDFTNFEILVR